MEAAFDTFGITAFGTLAPTRLVSMLSLTNNHTQIHRTLPTVEFTYQSTTATENDGKSTMTNDVRSSVLIIADKFHNHFPAIGRTERRCILVDSEIRCVVHLCPAHLQP